MLKYIQEVGKCADQEAFIRFLEQNHPEYKKAMRTIAEYLRQEGYKEALQASYAKLWKASKAMQTVAEYLYQEGYEKGYQTAERRKAISAAKTLLAAKVDIPVVIAATGLTEDDLSRLNEDTEE